MIDWKNKPEGAQRYNEMERCWLKREDGLVSYYNRSLRYWVNFTEAMSSESIWDNATPEPDNTPPLQLTWDEAPNNATHILQHRELSDQIFAVQQDNGVLRSVDDELIIPPAWFVVSERPDNSVTVDSTINERGERYGKFNDGANIMQTLKNVMRETDGWERLTASQREALEMIQHKIGRVLNGDPTYDDNWRDICGYSQLILDELNGTKR